MVFPKITLFIIGFSVSLSISYLHAGEDQEADDEEYVKIEKPESIEEFNTRLIKLITEVPADALKEIDDYTKNQPTQCGFKESMSKKLFGVKSPLNMKSSSGVTPLITAASEGKYEIIQKLLENPDLQKDEVDPDGNTAAMVAALRGFDDIVLLLKRSGANLNKKNKSGKNVFDVAEEEKKKIGIHSWTLLTHALSGKDLSEEEFSTLETANLQRIPLAVLLTTKVHHLRRDTLAQGTDSALIQAVRQGDKQLVHKILDLPETRIDSLDKNGDSSLMIATQEGFNDLSSLLVERGASFSPENVQGKSFLSFLKHENAFRLESKRKGRKLTSDAVEHLMNRAGVTLPNGFSTREVTDSGSLGESTGQLFLVNDQNGRLIYVLKSEKYGGCFEKRQLDDLYTDQITEADQRRKNLRMKPPSQIVVTRKSNHSKVKLSRPFQPIFSQLEKSILFKNSPGIESCLYVLHGAQGKIFADILREGNLKETLEAYESLGSSLGAFHNMSLVPDPKAKDSYLKAKSDIHGDTHAHNVFFDPSTQKITFIDNSSISQNFSHFDLDKVYRGPERSLSQK